MKLFKKNWLIYSSIFLLAFLLRAVAAFKVSWRPDEIVYVDWIGRWFSGHFFVYFFQFFHKLYPPESPTFGNPPLAMWIMTIGIWIAKIFHFSPLLGARFVNVIIGSLTVSLIFYFGRKYFSFFVGLAAAVAFAVTPIVVTNNGTAYLETVLTLLVLMAFDRLLQIIDGKNKLDFVWLGIVLGLAILTKFVAIPIALAVLIFLPIIAKKKKYFWQYYLILIALTLLLPVVLWAGLRDPSHILNMIYLYKNKIYSPYPTTFFFPIFRYYYLMLAGILPPVIILSALGAVIFFIRQMIIKKWQLYKKEIVLITIPIIYLAYNSIFTGYGGTHQVLVIIPFILYLAALIWEKIFNLVKPFWQKALLVFVLVVALALPLSAFRPELWSLYGSTLVGGSNEAFKLYTVGVGGEGVPEIADWLNKNTPENSRTAIVAYDWLLKKYLTNQTATSVFLQEGVAGAMARGADYVVLPRQYMEGNLGKTAQELSQLEPVYSYMEKGILMANIYKINNSALAVGAPMDLGSSKDWEMKRRNAMATYEISDRTLKIKYDFPNTFLDSDSEDNRFLISSTKGFSLHDSKGLYLEAYGDGNQKPVIISLIGDGKDVFSYSTIFDWSGWKRLYIPLELFYYEPANPGESEPNLKTNYKISLMVLSKTPLKGEVQITNIALALFNQ